MDKALFRAPLLEVPAWPIIDRAQDRAMLQSMTSSPLDFATARQPYVRGTGVRVHCDEVQQMLGHTVGEGYSDFVQLADDLCARVVNARLDTPTGLRCLGEDWLKIEIYISGRQSLVFEDVGQIDLATRWCHVHCHAEGLDKGDWMGVGEHGQGLIVYLRPAFLRDRLGEAVERLPPGLKQFARDGRPEFVFETLPVSAFMATAVQDVMATPFLGGLRRMFLEGKAIEVVSDALHTLSQTASRESHPVRLRQRDIERLHYARQVIERDYIDPPPIIELARRVGLNQQKLKCGFKALFGMTIFECYQDKRLGIAADLLRVQGASVGEAALAAGYEYPSNFAIAFKRKYGVPPKQFRKTAH